MAVNCRFAADIGGTFTDIAFVGEDGRLVTRKVPSTPERYGHAFAGAYPVETVNLRVIGTVPTRAAGHIGVDGGDVAAEESGRPVHFGPEFGTVETPVITRAGLAPGPRAGPMIVEEYEGTTVVPPDCSARLDHQGNIIIDVGGQA